MTLQDFGTFACKYRTRLNKPCVNTSKHTQLTQVSRTPTNLANQSIELSGHEDNPKLKPLTANELRNNTEPILNTRTTVDHLYNVVASIEVR